MEERLADKLLGLAGGCPVLAQQGWGTDAGRGNEFRIRRTDHFLICYDTRPNVLSPLVGRLEGTFNAILRFCQAIGIDVKPSEQPFGILLFDRHEDFDRFCRTVGLTGGSAAGLYDQGINVAAFGNTLNSPQLRRINDRIAEIEEGLEQLRQSGQHAAASRQRKEALRRQVSSLRAQRNSIVERFNRFVLRHEAAHQIFHNVGVHPRGADNPLWVVEGLACQFEVPESMAARGLGRVNHMRLADLRDALGVSLDAKRITDEQLEAALATDRYVSLERLVSQPELFAADEKNLVYRYAQAWGLVYYLSRKQPEPFAAYLRELADRKPGVVVGARREIEIFESHLGQLNGDLERASVDWILRLHLDRREAGR